MGIAILWLLAQSAATAPPPATAARDDARVERLISEIARSGRALDGADAANAAGRLADPRRQVAPGPPPLLEFRYLEGARRHRFGKLDLMIDDAGH
jgi:hypothetical protein